MLESLETTISRRIYFNLVFLRKEARYVISGSLDGVFANFDEAVFLTTGLHFKHGHGEQIFSILQDTPNFFRLLSPLPCSKTFMEDLLAIVPNAAILTAMPRPTGHFVTTAEDKTWWVKNVLGVDIPVICTPGWQGKMPYAKSKSDILVDDSFRNIEGWRMHGGSGVWHCGWEMNANTIRELKEVVNVQKNL